LRFVLLHAVTSGRKHIGQANNNMWANCGGAVSISILLLLACSHVPQGKIPASHDFPRDSSLVSIA
jgi:hypothetical protein